MSAKRHKFVSGVHLVLQKENTILLSRRYNTGYEDGNYSMAAGHIDGNEPAKLAMIREAKEEAGIDIQKNDLEVVHVMHRKGADVERIDFFMRTKQWKGELQIIEPDKCDDLRWFLLDELPNNIIPYIKSAMQYIKQGIFYSECDW